MRRIAIDMDEVIADFNSKHLKVYNHDYGDNLTIEDLKVGRLEDIRPHLASQIIDYLHNPLFFRDLEVMKDSQEVIRNLSKRYEIYITTAAMEFPSSFNAKYEWLREHFGFLNDMNFVFCGDKSIIHADYLIDDNVRHFDRFNGQGILFSAPHNLSVTGFDRVSNWQEVQQYFLKS
ncbi:5' nucleotidase, NT5C type [Paenibacillus wynnii]|uniref:5' nucleotidase, NT5C type n=1 Tax=Paenibacillus wynnii TaxID=268407 RepID=UPI00278E0FF0|nr:5'-3'-deoxyribonucleotidase [Paenibacillus wynnii]MDQ0195713.1 5'(3')-deoxyribonucleotidase [Paenibacillus wynnii]